MALAGVSHPPKSSRLSSYASFPAQRNATLMASFHGLRRWSFRQAVMRSLSGCERASGRQKQDLQLHRRGRRCWSSAVAAWKQEVLWTEASVLEVEEAGHQLFHVVLDISHNPQLMQGHSTPGQFVQIRAGGDSKPAFMAIASPPKAAASGFLEFLIKHVDGSTAGLLCTLEKGDNIELSQIMGNGFQIERLCPAEEYPTVLLFATGTGISPVRSLIEAGIEAHKRSDVRLYYGARNLERMAYQDKFSVWESSGVKIIPVLSQPNDNWSGECGYVQAAFAKAKDISNPLQTGAVLCGHMGMAQDVTSLLVAEGVSHDTILKNF